MRITLLACLTASTLAIAACGGSDDGASDDGAGSADTAAEAESDSSESTDQQQRVVDLLLSSAGEAGIEFDVACVDENIGQLSDDDAKALADAGLEGEADISEEANAIGDVVFSECVDAASYAKVQVDAIGEIDESIDTDCLREALDGLTVDEIDEQVFDAATECTDGS